MGKNWIWNSDVPSHQTGANSTTFVRKMQQYDLTKLLADALEEVIETGFICRLAFCRCWIDRRT